MKYFVYIIFVLGILAPSIAAAATFSLAPANGEFTEGDTFIASLFVNATSETVYTVKASLSYPEDILEITSFTLNNKWTALVQPGYDLLDNKAGLLSRPEDILVVYQPLLYLEQLYLKLKKMGLLLWNSLIPH